jgi:hypothetical protein
MIKEKIRRAVKQWTAGTCLPADAATVARSIGSAVWMRGKMPVGARLIFGFGPDTSAHGKDRSSYRNPTHGR